MKIIGFTIAAIVAGFVLNSPAQAETKIEPEQEKNWVQQVVEEQERLNSLAKEEQDDGEDESKVRVGLGLHGGAFIPPNSGVNGEIGAHASILGGGMVKFGFNFDVTFLPGVEGSLISSGVTFEVSGTSYGWDLMADACFFSGLDNVGFLFQNTVFYRFGNKEDQSDADYLEADADMGPYFGIAGIGDIVIPRIGFMVQLSI